MIFGSLKVVRTIKVRPLKYLGSITITDTFGRVINLCEGRFLASAIKMLCRTIFDNFVSCSESLQCCERLVINAATKMCIIRAGERAGCAGTLGP